MKIRYSLDVLVDIPPTSDVGTDPQDLTNFAAQGAPLLMLLLSVGNPELTIEEPESWVVYDDDGDIVVEHG